MLHVYPFTIRKKSNHYEVKESVNGGGYVQLRLNDKVLFKHRLIALQFIPNDDPECKKQVDHINHDKTDYHLSNLRWVTPSQNINNRALYNSKTEFKYVDEISDEATVVDFYETRSQRHEFENYYYHDGLFYYDNDVNYKVININVMKNGCKYVFMKSIEGKWIKVITHKFIEQHDLA